MYLATVLASAIATLPSILIQKQLGEWCEGKGQTHSRTSDCIRRRKPLSEVQRCDHREGLVQQCKTQSYNREEGQRRCGYDCRFHWYRVLITDYQAHADVEERHTVGKNTYEEASADQDRPNDGGHPGSDLGTGQGGNGRCRPETGRTSFANIVGVYAAADFVSTNLQTDAGWT